MKMQKLLRVVRFCLPLLTITTWGGKSPIAQESIKPRKFSLNAKPLPYCRSFLVTEFGYNYRFTKAPVGEDINFYFIGDFGWMKNRNERSAVGATLWRVGVKPRYRFWIDNSTSIDVSPGLFLWVHDDGFQSRFPPGFTGHVGLNLSNWLAITGQLDVIPYQTYTADFNPISGGYTLKKGAKGTDVAAYSGLKLGSTPGLIIGTVVSVAVLIAATSFSPL